MNRSELRPCDQCGQPLFGPGARNVAYKVRSSVVLLDYNSVRQNIAMQTMFGANAIAGNFAPEEIATVAGEKEPKLWTDLFLCMMCHIGTIGVLCEARSAALAEAEAKE